MRVDQRPIILLVDDEASILVTLKMFLELSGFEVSLVSDGREALERIAEIALDLVVMDVLMAGMAGRVIPPQTARRRSRVF